MQRTRALLLTAALGSLPVLSGCVAAIVPIAAAGLVAKKKLDKPHRVEVVEQPVAPPLAAPALAPVSAPTVALVQSAAAPDVIPSPAPVPEVAPAAASPVRVAVFAGEGSTKASLAPTVLAGTPAPPAPPRLYTVTDTAPSPAPAITPSVTTVTLPSPRLAPQPAPAIKLAVAETLAVQPALPSARPKATVAPVPASPTSSGYLGLTAFAISRANSPTADSALDVINPADPLTAPRRAQCGGQAAAVMIDLDPGLSVFDPEAIQPEPGLSDALAALRAAGIIVLWTSALPVEQAEKVHFALARAGLDPARIDRLLLLKGAGDRKQARRNLAARSWCVIAMAGDRRGDFDEVFDYLRDPDSKIPADALFGDGWFLAPPPMP